MLACALREKTWQLGCTTGHGQKPRERAVAARHQARLLQEIAQAQKRWGLPEPAPVVRCADAGRAGCWLQRFLPSHGRTTSVVDSASLEGHRRTRRATRDGVDGRQLVSMLSRDAHGARDVWRVVHVPSGEAADRRPLPRAFATLQPASARTTTRMQGLRSRQGVRRKSLTKLPEQLDALRLWDGAEMPRGRRRRVLRGWAHHEVLSAQMAALAAERRAVLHTSEAAARDKVRPWRQLRGIGSTGAGVVVRECFAWSACKHRRQVGG